MNITNLVRYQVWEIAVHNPQSLDIEPVSYSVFCSAIFTQPTDAVKYARKHAREHIKAGAPCVWTGVLCTKDVVFYNEFSHNKPSDICETIALIKQPIFAAIAKATS